MLIRRQTLESLGSLRPEGHLITTCYLNTDGKTQTGQDYRIRLKEAIRIATESLEQREVPDPARQAAQEDLERIRAWVEDEFDRKGVRGLAIFACGPVNLWEVCPLPRPVPSRVVQDASPYIRPLSVLLDEHPRFCAALVDREKARIFEVWMGTISECAEVKDEVPDQVRAGGWHGYDEKRISRHIEDHVHRHYRHTAEVLFDLFRRERFDWLVIGGHREAMGEFRDHLHSYVQERVKSVIEIEVTASESDVLERIRQVEQELEASSEGALLERLATEAGKGGLAVTGLEPVLEAIQRGAVHTLVVDNGAEASGSRCDSCARLTSESPACPACMHTALTEIPHLIDEAIEDAMAQGAEIEHILHQEGAMTGGPLAALLRFRYET